MPKLYHVAGLDQIQKTYGNDFDLFMRDLAHLDRTALADLNPEHEGTPSQWAPIFQKSPQTWRVILFRKRIVGYWHFLCLKPTFFSQVLNGDLVDSELRAEMMDPPNAPGLYKGYLVVAALQKEHRNLHSFALLAASLTASFTALAHRGAFFEQICAVAFTEDGKSMCELMGLQSKGRHPRGGDEEIAEIFTLRGQDIPTTFWGGGKAMTKAYHDRFSQSS